ncbi:uncharacterized protein [Diabrotica undecimpunctata]|uniref:uncharacterized protein n=1 Tax=Diabrotica undecimpunctata TaxID=50387 RepID=UPI003B6365CD
MKPACSTNCRNQCSSKLTELDRTRIFQGYYALANYNRQRDFIHSNTDKNPKKCTTSLQSKRNISVTFFLPKNNERIKVCKTMFINTLGIKKGVVDIAMKKRTSENTTEGDNRGKHVKKVTNTTVLENVKSHIQSFPTVPSHYCRSSTERHYLDSSLNITLMYRLYCELCDSRAEEKVSLAMYRKIFNENFNLSFHHPKKDQCRVCSHYISATTDEKSLLKIDYEAHLFLKDQARTEKLKDRIYAEFSNGSHICANFDLQQVLLVPSDPTNNALFYKRRLANYNFTIYNVVSKQGDCFIWNETQGSRGSCEIASAIYLYLRSLPETTSCVTFFSDRCGGQNLNQFTAAMLMKAVNDLNNLEVINMKFLISGHSEMECDSIHSAINTEFKRVGKALWPEDWKQIARGARRKGDKPYLVHDLDQSDIKDFKKFVRDNLTIRKKDENGNAVLWQKMCWLRFRKSQPFIMEFKESFSDEGFRHLNLIKRTRTSIQSPLQPLYQQLIPISIQKYKDLISLFSVKPPALGDSYRPFYTSLPYENKEDSSEIDDGQDYEGDS